MRFIGLAVLLLATICSAFAEEGASNVRMDVLVLGSEDVPNGIPFGGLPFQDRYQQWLGPWAFPERPILIKAVAFSSQPGHGQGVTKLNVTFRMGTTASIYPAADFDLNLAKGFVVFNGPLTAELTNQPGDLKFQLMRPFLYDSRFGKPLIMDFEIHDVSGAASVFRAGLSGDVARVYRNAGDGQIRVELGIGLQVRLEFIPVDK